MKSTLIILLVTSCLFNLQSQNFEKITFDASTPDGYYLAVKPASGDPGGVLLLLPGFAQSAESVFPESKLPNVAYVNGILTVAIAGGRKLYADDEVVKRLNKAITHIQKEYKVGADKFIIGGFSAGGTIGLRYAEYCNQFPEQAPIKPKAVFAVDSPVDLFGIWNYFQREIKKNYSEAGVGEAKFVSEIMLNEIGDPASNKKGYDELTPFSTQRDEPGNEKFITKIPVRFYEDVDVAWQLENRRRSLYDSNALDASELINRLLLQGNEKAEFIRSE
ncbi:MAG: hypothetical protein RIA63_15410, partial [Cyclobacteriaceae bacterium]